MKQIVLLMVSLFLVVGMSFVGAAGDVNINIGVPPPPAPAQEPPPPLQFAGPPDVVVVPSGTSEVYLVPNTVGLYFYGGYWYRLHRGYWFRGSLYSGPWTTIGASLVPGAVVVIPPDYILGLPPGYHRIHYGDFHSHWRDWGRNHYWNKHAWYRDHSQHRWGGRDFHRPPVGHRGGDVQRAGDVHKPPVHRAGDVHKPPVQRAGDVHKSPVNRAGDVHKSPAGGHNRGGQQHQGGQQPQ